MNKKVAIIVGATGGIGSAVARKLAQIGTKLVLAAEPQAVPMEINIQPESHLFF